ncbi:hypothetical protein Cst_c04000 [Thermoclostridium stercorarium subsp. stercorarium DSM 8532]|uniref:Uncharacterized protein n=1 Tax=Thermoclostridium stercorarium (strain ATCC 35414 / DSM 8532 / NCIMB 11754) TaxID=1121335 RepID=L7VKZ6_THES1|nr:hypothetical protein Cst_c04000 [Thermoclostridium stercorarium subsp. stercorarium DSM 8532]
MGCLFYFVGGVNVKYTYIQREYSEPFITIGEYIFETDPETFFSLCKLSNPLYLALVQLEQKVFKPFVDLYTQLETISTRVLEKLMQEPPRPGRGGLLPGEGDEALV